MDKLDETIQAVLSKRDSVRSTVETLRSQFEEARRKLESASTELSLLELELRTYQSAAEMRPRTVAVVTLPVPETKTADVLDSNQPTRRGGRKQGALSYKWRMALADVVASGNQPVDAERFYLLTRGRLGLKETSVRERVRQYVKDGHLTEYDGKVSVSESAIINLGLRRLLAGELADDEGGEAIPASAFIPTKDYGPTRANG